MLSIEVSRHLTRRGACRAAERHQRMLILLGWDRGAQVRRVLGLRRWAVVER